MTGPGEAFRVRRAAPGDEPTVRALRLEALADAPWAFGSTYERELARTDADWRRWFSPGMTSILEARGVPRGIVAGVHDTEDGAVCHLMAMWVHPELRGSGAADALVAAVLRWAAGEGASQVRLQVAKNNDRARRCYERSGFGVTGAERAGGREGLVEVEMVRPL
jgi:ribosomal protein S18 acetylase RimI-like enzyme